MNRRKQWPVVGISVQGIVSCTHLFNEIIYNNHIKHNKSDGIKVAAFKHVSMRVSVIAIYGYKLTKNVSRINTLMQIMFLWYLCSWLYPQLMKICCFIICWTMSFLAWMLIHPFWYLQNRQDKLVIDRSNCYRCLVDYNALPLANIHLVIGSVCLKIH